MQDAPDGGRADWIDALWRDGHAGNFFPTVRVHLKFTGADDYNAVARGQRTALAYKHACRDSSDVPHLGDLILFSAIEDPAPVDRMPFLMLVTDVVVEAASGSFTTVCSVRRLELRFAA